MENCLRLRKPHGPDVHTANWSVTGGTLVHPCQNHHALGPRVMAIIVHLCDDGNHGNLEIASGLVMVPTVAAGPCQVASFLL